jgi:probable phosphoglycerate mutase
MAVKRTAITLCLIQCGETTWQTDGRVRGATDLPLSEAGRAMVMRELHWLEGSKAAVVFHPSDEAAAETARLCAQLIGAKTKDIADLSDPNLGLFEGLTLREFEDRFPSRYKQWEDDPMSLAPPEGELVHDAASRLFKAVAKALKRSRGAEVAMVLHWMGLGMMRAWLADRPLNDFRAMSGVSDAGRGETNSAWRGVERYTIALSLLDRLEDAGSSAVASP